MSAHRPRNGVKMDLPPSRPTGNIIGCCRVQVAHTSIIDDGRSGMSDVAFRTVPQIDGLSCLRFTGIICVTQRAGYDLTGCFWSATNLNKILHLPLDLKHSKWGRASHSFRCVSGST